MLLHEASVLCNTPFSLSVSSEYVDTEESESTCKSFTYVGGFWQIKKKKDT